MSAEEIRKLINLLENDDSSYSVRLGPKDQVKKHHSQWEVGGCEELAKDIGGEVIVLQQPILNIVSAYVHHHAFENGVPILKYFDRHDRGWNGSKLEKIDIPAGAKLVYDKEYGNFYGHDAVHGYFCADGRYLEDLGLLPKD